MLGPGLLHFNNHFTAFCHINNTFNNTLQLIIYKTYNLLFFKKLIISNIYFAYYVNYVVDIICDSFKILSKLIHF